MAVCKERKARTWDPKTPMSLVISLNVKVILDTMDLTPEEYKTMYNSMVASRMEGKD